MKTKLFGPFSPGDTDMPAYPEEQLVLEALDDSHQAFGQLVKQYRYRVLRTIASIISDGEAAQDVAQETFLSAWSNLARLKESEKFGRWLNRIAINLSKDWLREQRKHQENTVSLEENVVVLIQELGYQRDRLRQAVWDAIDELAEDHREVVILHYISGYSYKEIGEMLSVPVSTVSGRLQKAKNQLRKEFLDMVTQLQLDIDSTVHKFLKEHAKQDGLSVEGLIIRLIERYKRDTDSPGIAVRKVEEGWWARRYTGGPSPDGRYLSFRSSDGNLTVRDLTTWEKREVTGEGNRSKAGAKRSCGLSTWSPDGKQIAYSWNNEGCNELRIIGLDGSKPRVLYRSEDPALVIEAWDWSQDGKFILGRRGESDIVLLSVADGSVRTLKSVGEGHLWTRQPGSPVWHRGSLSPDGRYVAYARSMEKSEAFDVFLLATDGSEKEVRLVGHTNSNDYFPVWTPDGKGIVFVCNRDPVGSMSLWITPVVDGRQMGEPQLVMKCAGIIDPLGFTREGSLYYSIYSEPVADIYVASLNMETGEVGSQPTRLRCEGNNGDPVWSPDGKSLAYMSLRYSPKMGHDPALVIRSMETGKEREIHPETYMPHATRLRWSPDGRSILCGAVYSNVLPQGLHLLDIQAGHVTTIVDVGGLESHPWMTVTHPEWSRDGKAIFYIHRHADKEWNFFSIVARDLATGEERELYTGGYGWCSMIVSPDGQELAISDERQKALKVIPTAGGEPRILRIEDWVSPITWTPDGRHVLYIRGIPLPEGIRSPEGSPRRFELCRIAIEGGKPERLREVKKQKGSAHMEADGVILRTGTGDFARIHPDGQRIAFARADGESQYEIWVMENLLTTFAADNYGLYSGLGAVSTDIYIASIDRATGEVLEPPKRAALRFEGHNYSPAWSPDGKSLAYVSERPSQEGTDPREVLVIRSEETGEERELYPEVPLGRLLWSPDGRFIICQWSHHHLIDVQTGDVTEMLQSAPTGNANFGAIGWSPDGKTIYRIRRTEEDASVIAHDLKTGKEKELGRLPDPEEAKAASPTDPLDCQQIPLLHPTRGIVLLSAGGGEPRIRVLLRPQNKEYFALVRPVATPDGRYILFCRKKRDQSQMIELCRIPTEGGEPQKLMDVDETAGHISVHPDGQRIAFHFSTGGRR